MAAEPPEQVARRARLTTALAGAFSLTLEWAVPMVAINVAWGIVVAAFLLVLVGFPILALTAPILAIPTSSLMRLAVAAVRAGVPTLRMAREELGRLPGRKLVLGTVQMLLLGVALANVGLAGKIGGVPGLLSGGVAVYAAVVTALLSVAAWPVVCDPRREGPWRDQLRLTIAVALRRPVPLGVLAGIVALAAYVSVQLIVPALFLPAVVLLAVAGYVVPLADEIAPPR